MNSLSTNFAPPAKVIPVDDYEDFNALTLEQRAKVSKRLEAMQIIGANRRGVWEGCLEAERLLGLAGFSAKNLEKLWRAWNLAKRNWRALAPKSVQRGTGAKSRDTAFRQFVNGLVGESVRGKDCIRAAWERMIREFWLEDKVIPTFLRRSEWWAKTHPDRPMPSKLYMPDFRKDEMPAGLCYDTFRRAVTKDKAVRAWMHIGYHDAHAYLPQLERDRSALRPMELVVADDWRSDLKVLVVKDGGGKEICYLNTIFFRCVGTGKILAYAVKPMAHRDDDRKTKIQLCREDVAMLTAIMIRQYGLPKDYPVTLLLEKATATLSKLDEAIFQSVFNGRIVVDHTQGNYKRLMDSGFRESGGQPWQKGWIEVYFRSLATRLSHLLGSTGRRYDADPGALEDMEKYALTTANAAFEAGLPLSAVQIPFLTVDRAHDLIDLAVKQIERNRVHKMQGFREVDEWLTERGTWEPITTLMQRPESEWMGKRIESHRESSFERFEDLSLRWPRDVIPEPALVHLAGTKQQKKIRGGAFTWKPKTGDDKKFWLPAHLRAEWEGQELLGILGGDGEVLHLFRPGDDLREVCSIALAEKPNPLDKSAMGRGMNRIHGERELIRENAAEFQSGRDALFTQMREHNEAALAPKRLGTEAAGEAMLGTEKEAKAKKAKRQSPNAVQARQFGAAGRLLGTR